MFNNTLLLIQNAKFSTPYPSEIQNGPWWLYSEREREMTDTGV